ncbi:6412_t:CDS:2 [Funneliformis geosporum]|uniref:6412_t:CDS:1 n=1 Tax=Funneliformis geosporum TaxID=1117311 RepID=A0A9W4SPS9_9GLOM|nr:6412_t:CDS:2 [Funneliformis geosporum]
MDKVMADKIIFELEQEKKLVNRTALAEWFANGCPFEEDEEVLEFIKSEVREREARENGAGVTYSGSTGPRKTSSLTISTSGTQTTKFHKYNKHRGKGFRSGKVSGPNKVSEREMIRNLEPTKSVEQNHRAKQECRHEGI